MLHLILFYLIFLIEDNIWCRFTMDYLKFRKLEISSMVIDTGAG